MNTSYKIVVLLIFSISVVPSSECKRYQLRPHTSLCNEKTALMSAIERRAMRFIKKLIAEGEDVNAVEGMDQPRMGYPVLRYALDTESVEIVRLLLQHGADPNKHTTSPIMTDRNSANVRNLPLLSYTIQQHMSEDIIKLLIEYGADVNQLTVFNEWTPLMVAAYYGNYKAVTLLIASGADRAVRNTVDGNRNAYDYAQEKNNTVILDALSPEPELEKLLRDLQE